MNYGDSVPVGQALPAPMRGVGVCIYSSSGTLPPWDQPGFRESVVKDPAGTILLVEQPNGRNAAGNDWPSFSAGPNYNSGLGLTEDCFQVATSQYGYGGVAYGLHSQRFNYLFHDGHVGQLKTIDTIGTGTVIAPNGMWTVLPGD